ncbi:MAG TPA: type II CAAX endopeptidase family protein, partial [Acetobacteraceae bacterium]|nr:type II CAAX endopeptidase family protein [Acetobacteraceae bacterium]
AVGETAATPQFSGDQTRPDSALRLLLIALAWVLAAFVAGFLLTFVVGFVAGFQNGLTAHEVVRTEWRVSPLTYRLLAAVGIQLTLFLAAWRRSRVVGKGDRRAGLGLGPLRRLRLLSVLAVTEPVIAISWVLLISRWLRPPHPFGFAQYFVRARTLGPATEVPVLFLMIALAPICEEMFFRGWLWTGLQRHWRPVPIMLATALPWLLLHMNQGIWRPLYLIPAAIFISVARHYCGGLRASILLHFINNGIAAALLVFLLWVR